MRFVAELDFDSLNKSIEEVSELRGTLTPDKKDNLVVMAAVLNENLAYEQASRFDNISNGKKVKFVSFSDDLTAERRTISATSCLIRKKTKKTSFYLELCVVLIMTLTAIFLWGLVLIC